jgi:hypothetical protein
MSNCENKRKEKGLKPCPNGKICNPKTGRCVKTKGAIGKKLLAKSKSKSSKSARKSKSRRRKSVKKSKSRRSKSVRKSKSRRSKSVRKSKSRRKKSVRKSKSRRSKSVRKSKSRRSKSVRKSKSRRSKSVRKSKSRIISRSKLGEQLVKEYEASPKLTQSGRQGKEGLTLLMTASNGKKYAIKTFGKQKSLKKVQQEAEIQNLVYDSGKVTARVYAFGKSSVNGRPFIIMDAFSETLEEWVKKQREARNEEGGIVKLSEKMQKDILNTYKTMDKINVLHRDPKPDNFMIDSNGKVYIIDFGMAKKITPKMLKAKAKIGIVFGEEPNIKIGLLRLMEDFAKMKVSAPLLYKKIQEIKKEDPKFYERYNIEYYMKKKGLL